MEYLALFKEEKRRWEKKNCRFRVGDSMSNPFSANKWCRLEKHLTQPFSLYSPEELKK